MAIKRVLNDSKADIYILIIGSTSIGSLFSSAALVFDT